MKYAFTAYGHPNVLATHRTTLEITKDSEMSKKGNCIIAVAADFSLERVKEIIRNCDKGKIKLTIEEAGTKEEVTALVNKNFSSEHEMVIRTGGFHSDRTLGTRADKGAAMLDRELVEKLKEQHVVTVTLEST